MMSMFKTAKQGIRRGAPVAGAALLASALFAAPSSAADTVKIGFAIAKTGFLGVATPVAEHAYILWRDQVNAKGGLDIGGKERRKIEFIEYDDQSDPTKTPQIYEKLISEDKVDLLIAPYGTPWHIALGPVVERHKFPITGAAAGSTLLRDLHAKYIFFTEPDISDAIARDLDGILKQEGFKSVAMLSLQLPLSLETKKYVTPLLQKDNISILVNDEYPTDLKDMTGMLSAVKTAKPDAVLGLAYPEDAILYVNTAREIGIDAKFQFLLIGPSGDYFIKKFPKDSEGLITIGHWAPNQAKWPKAKAFYDAYLAKWGEPPDYLDSVSSYMSVEVLEQAVAKVGLDHEKLRAELASDTFDTINGPVKYENAVNATVPSGLLQIQNGKLELIWPPSIATSKFKPKG